MILYFSTLDFIYLHPNLYYFLLLCFCFSGCFSSFYRSPNVKLFIWNLYFSMLVFTVISFPLITAFGASHESWYVVCSFVFTSQYFLISLVNSSLSHWLFNSMLYNFHIFVSFFVFLLFFGFQLISLRMQKILCISSIILNVLTLILWPTIWSTLGMFYVYLKRMWSLTGWGVLYIPVRSSWLKCCWGPLFLIATEIFYYYNGLYFSFNFANVCFI